MSKPLQIKQELTDKSDNQTVSIEDILNALDGSGLIITDWDLIIEELNNQFGLAIFDTDLNK
jgi:hypothetical protein